MRGSWVWSTLYSLPLPEPIGQLNRSAVFRENFFSEAGAGEPGGVKRGGGGGGGVVRSLIRIRRGAERVCGMVCGMACGMA